MPEMLNTKQVEPQRRVQRRREKVGAGGLSGSAPGKDSARIRRFRIHTQLRYRQSERKL
jgi:hypothetical protein